MNHIALFLAAWLAAAAIVLILMNNSRICAVLDHDRRNNGDILNEEQFDAVQQYLTKTKISFVLLSILSMAAAGYAGAAWCDYLEVASSISAIVVSSILCLTYHWLGLLYDLSVYVDSYEILNDR